MHRYSALATRTCLVWLQLLTFEIEIHLATVATALIPESWRLLPVDQNVQAKRKLTLKKKKKTLLFILWK